MVYELDYQGTGNALGLGFQPEGRKWTGGAPPPGYVSNTRSGVLGIPFKGGGGTSPAALNFGNSGNRFDQAVMSPYGAPRTISDAILPQPTFPPHKKMISRDPQAIADNAFNAVFNAPPSPAMSSPVGSGFAAIVNGKRINYADIGTKNDALSKGSRGGWAMGNGAIDLPPDPNMGLAVRDTQERQAALDMTGAGVGSGPISLGQRLSTIRSGRGPGGIVNAMMQSKVAKDDYGRFNKDRGYALNMENAKSDNDYNQGVLNLSRQKLSTELEDRKSAIDLRKAETEKKRWEISPGYQQSLMEAAGDKDRKAMITNLYNDIKKLNLPPGFEGKHFELSSKFAQHYDPDNDYKIYYNPVTPYRMGIGTNRKLFEPRLQQYLAAGVPEKDAYTRAFGDLQREGKQRGVQLYEDVPALSRFANNRNKPADAAPTFYGEQ